MRGYLANAACNGRRPKKVGPQRLYSRPRLVKRLMSERGVARFVIAPSGFGKTSLGLDYAGSMFSFQGVHWLDCQSPCFLRDLDAGAIAQGLSESPERAALVVFDDIPYLDDERSARFSDEIDAILECGCEVLAITTPAFSGMAALQRDCVVVGARDLLVDDAELAASRVSGIDEMRECDRVAAFVWGDADGMRDFLRGMRLGEMPAEMRAPVFVMEALQTGSFDDLSVVSGGVRADARRFISEHYPYVGVDLADETFCAHGLEIGQVVEGLGDSLDSIGRASSPVARDALSARVACMLASRGLGERACDIMREASARKRRIAWLVQQQWALFDAGCIGPSQDLFESLGVRASGLDASMRTAAAVRLSLLGDSTEACAQAARALGMAGLRGADELACCIIALRLGDSALRARAGEALQGAADAQSRDSIEARLAESALRAERGDVAGAYEALGSLPPEAARSRFAVLYAARLLGQLPAGGIPPYAKRAIDASKRLLDALEGASEAPTMAEALLSSALARRGACPESPEGRERSRDDMVVALAMQRHARETREQSAARAASVRASAASASAPSVVPEARVRVFGGLDVSIGGAPLDPNAFSKQRTKTLLAILVLFKGKEVPRGELLGILWPGMREDRATNNFYSLWCKLRCALGAGKSDQCPYLVRHKASVMLDARYVRTDVEEFEKLYRSLMFDEPNVRAWLAIFERMEEEFSCDLLPSETENRFIAAMRKKYRAKRVDAYVTAAMRLVDAGEPAAALWFAQAALEADPGREDTYFALMRAQAGNGQRIQAMETYHACGAYLAEHLGIDPSERMTNFYASLLEGK